MITATINGKNLTTFGAYLMTGAIEALLTPPPLKSLLENDSPLSHGKEILIGKDESGNNITYLDERSLSLSVFISGSSQSDYLAKYNAFVSELYKGEVKLAISIGNTVFTYYLLYDGCSKYGDYGLSKGKFVVKFREPNPSNRS